MYGYVIFKWTFDLDLSTFFISRIYYIEPIINKIKILIFTNVKNFK